MRARCFLTSLLFAVLTATSVHAEPLASEDIRDLRAAAEAGSGDAQLALGTALLEKASEADWAEGIAWLEKAARQGAPVYLIIADSYRDGIGVARDLTRAAHWYRIGAETGDGLAQLEIGNMYLEGEGVDRDIVRAVLYLELAVAHLEDPGRRHLAEEALMQARWLANWEDRERVRELLKAWKPKRLPDPIN